ncbi:MAG: CBS domain-containing protein [Pseudomonadota bacterium]
MSKINDVAIEEFTTFDAETCAPESSLNLVRDTMEKGNFRHMPVVWEGKVIGMVSQRDLALVEQLEVERPLRVEDIMAKEPYIVSANTPIEEVAFQMSEQKIGSAIVLSSDNSQLGVFTSTDALNALVEVVRGDI